MQLKSLIQFDWMQSVSELLLTKLWKPRHHLRQEARPGTQTRVKRLSIGVPLRRRYTQTKEKKRIRSDEIQKLIKAIKDSKQQTV